MNDSETSLLFSRPSDKAETPLSRDWLKSKIDKSQCVTILTGYWDYDFLDECVLAPAAAENAATQTVRIFVCQTDYQAKTLRESGKAYHDLDLKFKDKVTLKVYAVNYEKSGIFHIKAYAFGDLKTFSEVWMGSANATYRGFAHNIELLSRTNDQSIVAFSEYCNHLKTEHAEALHDANPRPYNNLPELLLQGTLWVRIQRQKKKYTIKLDESIGWKRAVANKNESIDGISIEDRHKTHNLSLPEICRLCESEEAQTVFNAFTGLVENDTDDDRAKKVMLGHNSIATIHGHWAPPQ